MLTLLANPRSGSGKALAKAQSLAQALAPRPTRIIQSLGELPTDPKPSALVIVGGDGSIHHALPTLLATGIPLYHAPTGTENLFAREFRMSASPAALDRALASPPRMIDVADVNQRPFAIMLSIGPDADVIRRLDMNRQGPISHASYIPHIVAEALAPALKPITVLADDVPFITDQRGMLVIANARQYALRIDPAPHARPDDALLNLIFFPASTTLRLSAALLLSRLRLHLRTGVAIATTAKHIRIHAPGAPVQADGESLPFDASNLSITLRTQALRVLAPSSPT